MEQAIGTEQLLVPVLRGCSAEKPLVQGDFKQFWNNCTAFSY